MLPIAQEPLKVSLFRRGGGARRDHGRSPYEEAADWGGWVVQGGQTSPLLLRVYIDHGYLVCVH
jgi:hypothetical protein